MHRQRVELTFGPRRDEREERREVAWSVLNADEKSAGKNISFLKLGKGFSRDTRSHAHSHTCPQTLFSSCYSLVSSFIFFQHHGQLTSQGCPMC